MDTREPDVAVVEPVDAKWLTISSGVVFPECPDPGDETNSVLTFLARNRSTEVKNGG